jgi:hypothetical protein
MTIFKYSCLLGHILPSVIFRDTSRSSLNFITMSWSPLKKLSDYCREPYPHSSARFMSEIIVRVDRRHENLFLSLLLRSSSGIVSMLHQKKRLVWCQDNLPRDKIIHFDKTWCLFSQKSSYLDKSVPVFIQAVFLGETDITVRHHSWKTDGEYSDVLDALLIRKGILRVKKGNIHSMFLE